MGIVHRMHFVVLWVGGADRTKKRYHSPQYDPPLGVEL